MKPVERPFGSSAEQVDPTQRYRGQLLDPWCWPPGDLPLHPPRDLCTQRHDLGRCVGVLPCSTGHAAKRERRRWRNRRRMKKVTSGVMAQLALSWESSAGGWQLGTLIMVIKCIDSVFLGLSLTKMYFDFLQITSKHHVSGSDSSNQTCFCLTN